MKFTDGRNLLRVEFTDTYGMFALYVLHNITMSNSHYLSIPFLYVKISCYQ